MKKATLKTYLLILIVLMLSVATALTAFACKSKTQQEEEETTAAAVEYAEDVENNLITNGNFSSASSSTSTTQLYSPSSWSTYTSGSTSSDNSVKGVIDTGSSDFAEKSADWNGVNPYGDVKDQRVLMVYNKTDDGNVYGYTATFTTDSYGLYKVTANVKVQDVTSGGATFRVHADNGFVAFDAINDTDAFKTYTIYFEASAEQGDTVTITLSLGYDETKVKGYAFFDDVVALRISEKDYAAAQAAAASADVKFGSFTYPNGEFDYFSGTGDYKTPTAWSGTKSHSDTYSNLDGVGVISVADWDEKKTEKYGEDPLLSEGSTDSNVLMIAAKSTSETSYAQSAYYYQSKDTITVLPSHLYEITLYVKATVNEDDSIVGKEDEKGASVVLYDTKDSKDIISSGMINTTGNATNNGWKKIVFRVLGDLYETKSFAIRLWIGSEKEENYTQGTAYFDRLTVTELDACYIADRTATAEAIADGVKNAATPIDDAAYLTYNFLDLGTESADVNTYAAFAPVKEGNVPEEDWTFAPAGSLNATEHDVVVKVIKNDFTNENVDWKETYGLTENPLYPYSFSSVLMVNNIYPSSYMIEQTGNRLEIKQNKYYRISLWIKTVGLEEGKTITLSLNSDVYNDGNADNDSEISSFTINTDGELNELSNGYYEYTFCIQGAPDSLYDEIDNRTVYLAVRNGTKEATAYDPSNYQKGAFLIADIHYEVLTNDEYTKISTGTYTKKYSFTRISQNSTDSDVSAPATSSENWDFHSYDMTDVEMDDETQLMKGKTEDGKVQVGKATSWTSKAGESYGKTYYGGESKVIAVEKKDTASDDEEKDIEDIEIDKITSIRLVGDLKTTFSSSSAWEKYLTLDKEEGKIGWVDNRFILSTLTGAQYDLTVKVSVKDSAEGYFLFENNEIAWATKASVLPVGTYTITIKINKADETTRTQTINLNKSSDASNKEEFILNEGESINTVTLTGTVSLTLDKAADATVDLAFDDAAFSVTSIELKGAVEYLFTSENDWNSYFTIDEDNHTIKLKSSEYIAGKTYTVTIRTNEKVENDLIGGIINVNNESQMQALELTREDIYDNDWANVSDDTKLLPVDFGMPYLYILTNKVTGKAISLKNATGYKQNTITDLTKTPVLKPSSTFTLSANSYYVLTFYAKTLDGAIGQVYLTNSSYNMTMPYFVIENTDGWMEYNFLIDTGLKSSSVNFEIYYGEKGNETDTYTGTILLDSFSSRKIESKDEYEELMATLTSLANDAYSQTKLIPISFDKDMTDTSAVDPSGFTEENSSTSNIVSGIIYKDTFDFSKLGVYKDETSQDETSGEEVKSEVADKTFTKEEIFNDDAKTGDYLLIINNIKRNYQQYSITASLSADKYYKYSALLRTLALEEGKTATLVVVNGDENYSMSIDTQGEWKEYTFYLTNTQDADADAKLCFRLGENTDSGKIRGILLIDNVTITEIDKDAYDAAMAIADQVEKDENGNVKKDENGNVITTSAAAAEFYATSRSIVLKEDSSATDDTDTDDSTSTEEDAENGKTKIDTSFLWLYITSIVIAVALIVIIAIWLYKKYRRPGKRTPSATVSYDRNKKSDGSEEASKSGSARDEYKD